MSNLLKIRFPENTPPESIVRWEKAMREMLSGYHEDPGLDVQFPAEGAGLIISRGITFSSVCEHHLLPFFGVAEIKYVPSDKIVGLSKLARTVGVYSRRLQLQERLTGQIAQAIQDALNPVGVSVTLKGTHTCQGCRGVRQQAEMITTKTIGNNEGK